MARVTIEDCTKIVPSRFELVILAAQRAKDISAGSPLTIDRDDEKNAVLALREISIGNVDPEVLKEAVIKKHQKVQNLEVVDVPDEMVMTEDMMEISEEVKGYASSDGMSDDDGFHDAADIEETEE